MTINGIVTGSTVNSTVGPLANYTVAYDPNTVTDAQATLTTTTNAQGQYSITVPYRDITGSDFLDVTDTLGGMAAIQSVTLTTSETGLTQNITITGPSNPAPLSPQAR